MEFTFDTANEAFEWLYDYIIEKGIETEIHTKAIYNTSIFIERPQILGIQTEWRKWSEKYADREWEWYLSKNRSVKELKKYAPTWDKMHGGDNIVNSNYGWQWSRNEQLLKVFNKLQKDPNTRQAWITIYDGKEIDDYAYDTPCTIGIGFKIRKQNNDIKCLDMDVIMRSNDIVYGFCNDVYCFSKLMIMMATMLNVRVGYYHHYATDLHIYDYHWNMKSDYNKLNNIKN